LNPPPNSPPENGDGCPLPGLLSSSSLERSSGSAGAAFFGAGAFFGAFLLVSGAGVSSAAAESAEVLCFRKNGLLVGSESSVSGFFLNGHAAISASALLRCGNGVMDASSDVCRQPVPNMNVPVALQRPAPSA